MSCFSILFVTLRPYYSAFVPIALHPYTADIALYFFIASHKGHEPLARRQNEEKPQPAQPVGQHEPAV